jgi:hypothetical protein
MKYIKSTADKKRKTLDRNSTSEQTWRVSNINQGKQHQRSQSHPFDLVDPKRRGIVAGLLRFNSLERDSIRLQQYNQIK